MMPDEQRIPTTFEMDGLLTEKDIQNRHKVMVQCKACLKWTQQDKSTGKPYTPCANCSSTSYDIQSAKSLRTFDIFKDTKRKPKK